MTNPGISTTRDARHAPPEAAVGPLAALGLALVPLALLAGVLVLIGTVGLPAVSSVPVEELAVENVRLEPGLVRVTVRNVGPEPVTVAQVTVNDMLTGFSVSPEPTVPRLRSAVVEVPHDWVEGEPVTVTLITTNSFKFDAEVAAAVASPRADGATLGTLALLGLYVGAVPVLLGLLWRPLLVRAREDWLNAALGLTVGLLLFLAADALLEGLEVAEALPGAVGGPFLLALGAVGAFAVLETVSRRGGGATARPATLAVLVALGIGLHNLAEGLAIGGAFALGEVALGAFLIVGFAVHNTTEGLAIVAPLSRDRARVPFLVALGLLAGLPVIPGAWVGTFAPSPYLALAFLGIGAGAILQVSKAIDGGTGGALRRGWGLAGVAAGALVMYATSLFVAI